VSKGIAPAGIEYYLPLFFDKTATLFDYLPKNATLCLHHDVDEAIATFSKDAASRYNLLRGDPQWPLLETKELFLDAEQFFIRAKNFARLDIVAVKAARHSPCSTAAIPPIAVNRRAEIPTQAFQISCKAIPGACCCLPTAWGGARSWRAICTIRSRPGDMRGLRRVPATHRAIRAQCQPAAGGFTLPDEEIALVTETELYAAQPRSAPCALAKKTNVEGMLRDLSELNRAIRWCMNSTASRAIRA
jgi:transcription-repair coupling factor (superfamily II helicase)